jgi:PEP-CTERM motif
MSAPRRSQCIAAIIACVTLGGFANRSLAGPIAAGSVAGGPPLLGSLTPGSVIDDSHLIKQQYSSVGLDSSPFTNLALAALGSINGTTAFVPTSATGAGFTLDFASFIGFQVVNPTTGVNSTTNHLSVEFVGPGGGTGFLYAMTPEGGILGSTFANDGVGPHGGHLATLDINGIGLFAAWSIADGSAGPMATNQVWGLSLVDFTGGTAPPPSDGTSTPEPATLALAVGGLCSAMGVSWKRRRNARS